MTPADVLRHEIVGRAAYLFWVRVVAAPLMIGFLACVVGCFLVESLPARVLMLCIALVDFLVLVVIGTTTARCRDCSGPVTWFGISLGRDDAVAMVRSARNRGVQLRLPYRAGGEPCERVNVSGFACGRCRLLHIGEISDPNAS